MIKKLISKVVKGEDLTETEMGKAMEEIMTGTATPAQIGAFITALRLKGETVDEITGAARAIRAKTPKICVSNHKDSIDSGNARNKLVKLVEFTQQCRPFIRNEPMVDPYASSISRDTYRELKPGVQA